MRIAKKSIETWVEALRNGKYKQTKRFLQNGDKFCCLGVACDLFIPKNRTDFNSSGEINGGMPFDQSYAPKWLQMINSDFGTKFPGNSLAMLNDAHGATFDEIADLLQAVYLEEVLSE